MSGHSTKLNEHHTHLVCFNPNHQLRVGLQFLLVSQCEETDLVQGIWSVADQFPQEDLEREITSVTPLTNSTQLQYTGWLRTSHYTAVKTIHCSFTIHLQSVAWLLHIYKLIIVQSYTSRRSLAYLLVSVEGVDDQLHHTVHLSLEHMLLCLVS